MSEFSDKRSDMFNLINPERVIRQFEELVKIYSPSRGEREIMDFIKHKVTALGFEAHEDNAAEITGGDAGNLIVKVPGNIGRPDAPGIIISAHVDNVEPGRDVEPVNENGSIRSKGDTILGADDKAGVAAMLELLSVMAEKSISHPAIQLVFTVSEEIGLLGAKALDMSENHVDHIYVLDSEGPIGTVVIAAPYQDSFEVEYKGRAAHAGVNPEYGINAIVAASKAICNMKLGRIDDETSANVGIIDGGRAGNIVPETANVFAECRSIDKDKLEAQAHHMIECFKKGADEVGADVVIKRIRPYEGYKVTVDDPIVKNVFAAAKAVGLEPKAIKSGGGSDTNVFAANGISAVNLGVGFEKVHSTEESISVSELVNLVKLLVALVSVS
jgi:tripeptide aminopeptidase